MNTSLLEQNLACLAGRHTPQLADAIRQAHTAPPQKPAAQKSATQEPATQEPAVTLQIEHARSGVAGLAYHHSGRTTSAHSRIDPRREAERFIANQPTGELYIFLGFGMGYHIEALLKSNPGCYVLIIEHAYDVLHVALSGRDMRGLLSDPRIDWLVAPHTGEIAATLGQLWIPALMGNAITIPLRTRIETRPIFFEDAHIEIEHCLAGLRQSYRTQAAFGRRWLHNMILNLTAIFTPKNEHKNRYTGSIGDTGSSTAATGTDGSTHTEDRFEDVALVMAGPTLAAHLDEIAALKADGAKTALIAVDTAVPIMRAHGIVPDIVLSIDCQQISYLHFMAGLDRRTRLALAIGSPPILARQTNNPIFCRSDHPLAHYIDQRRAGMQAIDMTAGNVGHAAYSLALSLGARRIRLFGDDFRYTNGIPYPRGVYLYDHFASRCRRLQPMEGELYGFMLRDPHTSRTPDGSYTTPLLTTYRQRFEHFVRNPSHGFHDAPHIRQPIASAGTPAGTPSTVTEWQHLLREYSAEIDRLPTPTTPFRLYFDHINAAERLLILTLAPLMAHLRLHDNITLADSFDQARRYTRRLIARRLRHRP